MPAAAITTHRHVDLDGERSDPRSFDWSALQWFNFILKIIKFISASDLSENSLR